MWQKLKEQIPAVILTAILVGGAIFWFHQKTVQDLSNRQQAEISALREQTQAELKASGITAGQDGCRGPSYVVNRKS